MIKKYILLCVLLLLPFNAWAFLGEDLGLDMYKQIDEGFYELERKQYEYELSWQGQSSIADEISPILNELWIYCDIKSIEDIENMIGNTAKSQVEEIFEACSEDWGPIPNILVEQVVNQLNYIKDVYSERARDKALQTYELARVWIYSDGSLENSPFDLMYDLEEIDRIVFSEDVEFQDTPVSQNSDDAFDDFLASDTSVNVSLSYNNSNAVEAPLVWSWTTNSVSNISWEANTGLSTPRVLSTLEEHQYVCAPSDISHGFGTGSLNSVLWNLGRTDRYRNTNSSTVSSLTSWSGSLDQAADGSAQVAPVLGGASYTPVTDSFGCDWFFCITVETRTSNYGTQGSNPISLESILSKAAEHLEKQANASLTQRKMATNNFEISSIIRDLPWMLRGFGIQVQSKPVPILDLDSPEDDEQGDPYATIQMLEEYYKNIGLDYQRRNDLDILENTAFETRVLQSSAGMSVTFPEIKMNELTAYQDSLSENNRVFSQSVTKKVLQDDMNGFVKQFSELERFVSSIEDFSVSVWSLIDTMKKIPTRSS